MYLVIVKVENNRVTKFAEYAIQADANAHVLRVTGMFPNAFVWDASALPINKSIRDLWVVGQTVTIVPFIDVFPTADERIDYAFPITVDDRMRVLFEALFEVINRVRVLEGLGTVTKLQLRDWLKTKL